jgi:hypothetical protein
VTLELLDLIAKLPHLLGQPGDRFIVLTAMLVNVLFGFVLFILIVSFGFIISVIFIVVVAFLLFVIGFVLFLVSRFLMASGTNHPAIGELLAKSAFQVVEDFGQQPDLGGIFAVGFLRGGNFLADGIQRLGDFQRRDRWIFVHRAFNHHRFDSVGLLRCRNRNPASQQHQGDQNGTHDKPPRMRKTS